MWSTKKKTIKVYFVLTEGRTDIENMSETMQLALQVSENVPTYIRPLDSNNSLGTSSQ